MRTVDKRVRAFYDTASDEEKYLFEERAGILEYDAGMSRRTAEGVALKEIQKGKKHDTIRHRDKAPT